MFFIMLAWVLSYYLRFYSFMDVDKGIPNVMLYIKLLPFILLVWFFVFRVTGFTRRSGIHRSAFVEALDGIQSCILASFVFVTISFFYDEYKYSRLTLLLFFILHPFLFLAGRSILRKLYRKYRKNKKPRKVLIIGGGDNLTAAVDLVYRNFFGPCVIQNAVLVNSNDELRAKNEKQLKKNGISILEKPQSWGQFFTDNPVESVIIAVRFEDRSSIDDHLSEIVEQNTDVKIIPDIRNYTKYSSHIQFIDQTPLLNIYESPLHGIGLVYKRILDLAGGFAACLLFSPIMIIISLLIYLRKDGPIIYKQERMGMDGKVFKIYKFRSMPTTAEKESGAIWASKLDRRADRLGSFIRRTSLDELPQLFNVLRGDMSLVGPRPERPIFVNKFRHQIPGYMLRHKVKAGMTGWAQINGWRGNTSLEKRIECDLYYIQNWSILLDIKILILTAFKGFMSPNAY